MVEEAKDDREEETKGEEAEAKAEARHNSMVTTRFQYRNFT
jgi:hypothetical protein